MSNIKKRVLSMVLTLAMLCTLLPSAALAATEVTVSFDARNGETIAPVDTIDSKITLPNTDPTWKDYHFDGWYTTIDGVNGTKVTADTSFDAAATVYAKWTKDTITVRTEALNLTDSPIATSDQGWAWNDDTSTLTLTGAIFDLTHTKMAVNQDIGTSLFTFGYAIQTQGGTVINLVGTSSVIGPEVFSDRVPTEMKTSSAISAGVLVQGACTIEGEGSLTAQGGKAIFGTVTVSTADNRAGVGTVNAGIYCNDSSGDGRLTVKSGTIIAKGGSYQNTATVTGDGTCTNTSFGLLAVRYAQSGGTVTGESSAEEGLGMAVGVLAAMEAVLTGGVLNGACTASSAVSPSAIKVPDYAPGAGPGGSPGGFSAENALYKGSATADGELIKAELASGSFTVGDAPAMKVNITFPPTIKLGAQTGPATFGTEANATYTVTAKGFGENDFPAYNPSIQWKDGETWSTTAPTGVTAALNDQKNSVTVTYDGAANAGDYLFQVVSPEASPLTGNYASADTTFTVSKASYTADPITKTVEVMINKDTTQPGTLTAGDFFTSAPAGAKITAVAVQTATNSILSATPTVTDGTLSYTGAENLTTKDLTDTYNVTISTTNYSDITATLTFAAVSKTDVTVDVTAVSIPGVAEGKITYTGNAMTYVGTPSAPLISADGFTYTWQKKNGGSYENILNNVAPQNAGDYKLIVAVNSDNADFMGSTEIAFTIAKKPVTVSVKNVGIHTGSAVPAPELVFDGLIGGDVITLTPTPVFECKKDGVTVDGKTAGTYDIVWTNRADVLVTGDENYDVTLPDAANAKGTLTVTTPSSSSGGGSSTPSAGIVIDGKTENLGTVSTKNGTTTVTLNEKKLSDKLSHAKDGGSVVIPVSGSANSSAAQLTGKSVEDMAKKDMTLTVQTKGVTYEMPAAAVDTADVLAELGATDASKVPFTVTVTQEKNLKVADATVIGTPVTFAVTASYNGKSVTVDHFSTMVSRSISITKEQAGKISTAVVVENGKVVRHVPTDVYELNGKFYAKINSMTNSTYTLIANDSSFTDVKGKWYAPAADELSAREVTRNVFGTEFEGEKNITRAEFAALLVNAMGLPTAENATFHDVASDAWYSKAVATASRYGVVKGVGNNSFAPDATITRQEAMVMLTRAAALTDFVGAGKTQASFSDTDLVATWATEGVDFNVANGLIIGVNGKLNPTAEITRAETATVLLRLLQKAELVDVRSQV